MTLDDKKRLDDQMKKLRKKSNRNAMNRLYDWDNYYNAIILTFVIVIISVTLILLFGELDR